MCCSTVTAVEILALLNSSPLLTTLPAADHKQDTSACEDDLLNCLPFEVGSLCAGASAGRAPGPVMEFAMATQHAVA